MSNGQPLLAEVCDTSYDVITLITVFQKSIYRLKL